MRKREDIWDKEPTELVAILEVLLDIRDELMKLTNPLLEVKHDSTKENVQNQED